MFERPTILAVISKIPVRLKLTFLVTAANYKKKYLYVRGPTSSHDHIVTTSNGQQSCEQCLDLF